MTNLKTINFGIKLIFLINAYKQIVIKYIELMENIKHGHNVIPYGQITNKGISTDIKFIKILNLHFIK